MKTEIVEYFAIDICGDLFETWAELETGTDFEKSIREICAENGVVFFEMKEDPPT